jgi:hypothetical protein
MPAAGSNILQTQQTVTERKAPASVGQRNIE